MRAVLLLGLLLASPAQCQDPPSGEGEGGAAAGGASSEPEGPPPVCDERGDCAVCMSCATAGPCATTVQACEQSPNCLGYAECLNGCSGNAVCSSDCAVLYPDGAALHDQAMRCIVCSYCSVDCGSPPGCP